MNIQEARNDRSHLMNITDMLAVASAAGPIDPCWGETKATMRLLVAYFGGFNVGSDTSAFDGLRK